MKKMFLFLLTVSCFSSAMEFETVRIVLWKRTESIRGLDIVYSTERAVDYVATLPRPSELLKGIKYECKAKVRSNRLIGTPNNTSVDFINLFDIKDCSEVQSLFAPEN